MPHSTLTVNCISSLAKSPEQCCKFEYHIESALYKCPLLLLLLLLLLILLLLLLFIINSTAAEYCSVEPFFCLFWNGHTLGYRCTEQELRLSDHNFIHLRWLHHLLK